MAEKDLKRLIKESAAETRRHFDVVAENLDKKIQMVAEVVNGKVETLRDEMNQRFADVDRHFAKTQAILKFSYSELEKRVHTAEDTLADHKTRLERLEVSHRPS